MAKTTDRIQAVIDALDKVTVKGHENWSILLGSLQTLAAIKRDLEGTEARQAVPAEEVDA